MADSIPSAEAVVLILTSCTAGGAGRSGWSQIGGGAASCLSRRTPAEFGNGEVKDALCNRLWQLECAGPGRRLRTPRRSRSRATTSSAVYKQAVHRVRHRVKRRPDARQIAERQPSELVAEAHLEDDAVPVLGPGPIDGPASDGRLDKLVPVRVLP